MVYEQTIDLVVLEDGQIGSSSFIHIKFSDDGKIFTSNNGEDVGLWIGFYVSDKQEDSTNFNDYKWKKYVGENGVGISGIIEYYLATSQSSGVTTDTSGWTTTVPSTSAAKKYLWNYETINYTDGSTHTSLPKIIGMFSSDGEDGKGIISITNYYLAYASNSGVTTSTSGWTTNIQTITTSKRYLWNYEVVKYTDNTSSSTLPVIIGVYGDTGQSGKGVTSIIEQYYHSTSAMSQTGGSWGDTVPTWVDGKYIWTRSVITYTDSTTNTTTPVCVTGGKGGTGSDGNDGIGIANVDVMYYLSTSATSLTGGSWSTTSPTWVNGKFIWSKTVTKYSDNTTTESNPACITGGKGETGKDGVNGKDAYTVILQNENISFAVDANGNALSDQLFSTGVIVLKGTTPVTNYTIGNIASTNGITAKVTNKIITLSVLNGATITDDIGEFIVPITVDGLSFEKKITWSLSKQGVGAYTHIRYALDSTGLGMTDKPSLWESSGRNLYLGTKDFSGTAWKNSGSWTTDGTYNGLTVKKRMGIWGGLGQHIAASLGEEYTFSGYVKNSVIGNIALYGNASASDVNAGKINNNGIKITHTEEWTKLSVTFKVIVGGKIQLRFENSIEGGTLFVCGLKLEKGTTATPWTPAPEDYPEDWVQPYIGIATTDSEVAPTDASAYTWMPYSEDLKKNLQTVETTISNVNSKVDAAQKAIIDEVWRDTLVEVKDKNGNVVETKSIESLLVSNRVDLNGITQEVKDVKTYVGDATDDPDGDTKMSLTEKMSFNKQTAESIRQSVDSVVIDTDAKIADAMQTLSEQTAAEISDMAENQITGEGSYVNQRADEIQQVVGKDLFEAVKLRYVRDWLYSNDKDTQNRFVECKVLESGGINIAKGKIPTTYDKDGNIITGVSNLSKYTDETIDNTYIYNANLSMLQLDLGSIYDDIQTIQIYHYFADSRVCDSKLEISEDGENWITIYESSIDGKYTETSDGYRNTIQSRSVSDQISFLKQTINSFNMTVQENSDKYAQILADQESITNRVKGVEDNISSINTQILDANGWKLQMKKIGAYNGTDVDDVETCIAMDTEQGITVTSSTKQGYKTSLMPDELAGYYNDGTMEGDGEKVFSVRGDLTKAKRFQTETGVDYITMKQIPVAFVKNGIAHNMLAIIRGGGEA